MSETEVKKKQNKSLVIGLAIAGACLGGSLIFYYTCKPSGEPGSKNITVEVINSAGEKKTYTDKTDANYLREAMDELSEEEDFSYTGSESAYGLYIESINGEKADYNKDKAYWSIQVNGEYGQYGADSQPVSDNDKFSFVYDKAN